MADVVKDFQHQFCIRAIIDFSQKQSGRGVEKSLLKRLFMASVYAKDADFEQACGNLLLSGAASINESGVITLNNLPELP